MNTSDFDRIAFKITCIWAEVFFSQNSQNNRHFCQSIQACRDSDFHNNLVKKCGAVDMFTGAGSQPALTISRFFLLHSKVRGFTSISVPLKHL